MDFRNFVYKAVGITDVIKVSDIKESAVDTSTHIGELVNGIRVMAEHVKENSENKQSKTVFDLLSRLGLKGKDTDTKLYNLVDALNKCRALTLEMNDTISELGDDAIITFNSMSYKTSAALNEIERVTTYANAISDITITISYMLNNDDLVYKNKLQEIARTCASASVTTIYFEKLDVVKVAKHVNSLSDESVSDDDNEADRNAKNFEQVPVNEFLYNPIYHARKWWLDIRFVFHEKREIEANLLRLKIAELKASNSDMDISESIEYYEDKLQRVEMKIKDFEEGD